MAHRRLLALVVTLGPLLSSATPPNFVSTPTVASTAGHQVLVTWTTSITATSQIAWGPSSSPTFAGYPNLDAPTVMVGTQHSRTLRRLPPGTWFFRVRSTNGPDLIDSAELSVTVPANELPLADAALDGPVNSLVARNGTFYAGGSFTRRFDLTGSAFVATRAAGSHAAHFPEVVGQVNAVARDGRGGFILCGRFRFVGGQAHQSLARLLADGNVDPSFTAGTDGVVNDCAVTGETLFAVGSFSSMSGQSRGRAAAIDISSNTILAWNPNLPSTATTVATDGTMVWIGGEFTTPRLRLAAFNVPALLTSPAALQPFQADVDATVFDLELAGSTLFLGGRFGTVAGSRRTLLAAVDAATGALQTFAPDLVGTEVNALKGSGGVLYVGGTFSMVGGAARVSLAAVDPVTGAVQASFNPALSPGATVYRLEDEAGELFIGGVFSSIGGNLTRRNAASLTLATSTVTAFNPDLSGAVRGFGVLTTGDVLVAGAFGGGNNSSPASRFLRADALTGAFAVGPAFNGTVFALAAGTDELYATGFFTTVGGQARSNAASLDFATAGVTGWAPVVNQSTHGVGVGPDGTIYLAGDFTAVNGAPRSFAAAVSPDGGVLQWDPSPNASVESLHVGNDAVFLGGTFTTLGATSRGRIGAVDFSGNVLPWSASANGTVFAINSTPTAVFVGGAMSQCAATNRAFGCSFNAAGALLPWDPRPNGQVSTVVAGSGSVIVGGTFSTPRELLLVTNDTTGALNASPFEMTGVGSVRAVALDCTTNRLALGGSFLHLGPSATGGFVIVDGAPACTARLGRITLVADAGADAGVDAGVDAGADAGPADAGPADAGQADAGDVDAGPADAGPADAGPADAGSADAGPADAGPADAGPADAGTGEDAGVAHGPYVVGCGCTNAPGFGVVLVALALVRRRHHRSVR